MALFVKVGYTLCAVGVSVTGIMLVKDFSVTRYFCPESIHDTTVVITGGTSGIGEETARELGRRGASVILACRDEAKCLQLNLTSLKSIEDFVDRLNQRGIKIDVLVNNAAISRCPKATTKEGFEMQMGVNYLGPFYLTNLMLNSLKETGKTKRARIVNVNCIAYKNGDINFDDFNSENGYNAAQAYANSKLALALFTKELAERVKDDNIQVLTADPETTYTALNRYMGFYNSILGGLFVRPFFRLFTRSPLQGAQTVLHCAVSPDTVDPEHNGKYYRNCVPYNEGEKLSDKTLAKKLWALSERWTMKNEKYLSSLKEEKEK